MSLEERIERLTDILVSNDPTEVETYRMVFDRERVTNVYVALVGLDFPANLRTYGLAHRLVREDNDAGPVLASASV